MNIALATMVLLSGIIYMFTFFQHTTRHKKAPYALIAIAMAITLSACAEGDQASAQDSELDEAQVLIEELEATIIEKDEEIDELSLHIEETEEQLDSVEEDLRDQIEEEYKDEISSLNEQITEKSDSLSNNEATISKLEEEVSTLKDELDTAKSETVSASTSESSSEESNHSCPAGSIHINTASEAEVQGIYQIGPDRASQIMQLRPFSSYNDMKRISGIGDKHAQAIEAEGKVCFE
ncbi:helix-hairpin-helix domain-containing protein [Shouchella sp. JSM 1781072]|uniref:helix-hairpin-helix domain-containing protein n=1 Tax=Shouchella sp. JSM 1781072 TaxID=3344581 RepID=UPI0035C00C77